MMDRALGYDDGTEKEHKISTLFGVPISDWHAIWVKAKELDVPVSQVLEAYAALGAEPLRAALLSYVLMDNHDDRDPRLSRARAALAATGKEDVA